MNANRMKYSSTPTYGIQKRGLLSRKTAAQPRSAESPDFSQAPDGMFNQPFLSTPTQQPGYPSAPFAATPPPAAPWFPQGNSIPPMQGMPSSSPFSYPMGAGNMQQPAMGGMPQSPMGGMGMPQAPLGGMGMPQAGFPGGMAANTSPFSGMQNQQGSLPPLGNNASGVFTDAQSGNFSPRAQGFVPPKPQQNPLPYQGGVQPGGFGQPIGASNQSHAPAVQPAPFMNGAGMPNPGMYNAMPSMNAIPQGMGFTPEGQNPYSNIQPAVPFQPAAPAQSYGTPQTHQRAPMDMDKLWVIFLFGVLPLLFIPCIFVPQSFNFIRYAFLVLSVCGMGGMWYRQMYGSATRMIISVVYVALCIVTVSMLMQGNRDIQQTNAGAGSPAAQTSIEPNGAPAAAAVTEVPSPTPGPTVAGKSEAQMRLETFMSNWAGNRVEDMVRLVQPSWATAQDTPTNRLFMLLGNRTPLDYTVEDISGTDEDTSRTVTMTATIDKNNGKDPSVFRFMVLMVKEGGEWYVDPASLATNDQVESDEGNVVNNANAAGVATEAPRTTVSPAPPSSTILYYNPDGGNFYHMDANCANIKEEYRPLQGSFSYSELPGYIKDKNLKPCLACGAPTATLAPEGEAQ